MKKILISLGSIFSFVFPVLALAEQASFKGDYVNSLTRGLGTILRDLIVVLIALAVVWFIWNVISYTMTSDEDKKSKAKDQMINGIIAIAVSVSVWGLVALLQNAFLGGGSGGAPTESEINSMIPGGSTQNVVPALRVGPVGGY